MQLLKVLLNRSHTFSRFRFLEKKWPTYLKKEQKSKSPLRYEWFNQLRRFSVVFQKNVHVGMIQFDGLEWLNDLLDNVKE